MTLVTPAASDFPVLPHTGVAYLDSGATSQTPIPVIEAMDAYYREYRASIHSGIYPIAALATEAYEMAREKVAAFAGSAPVRSHSICHGTRLEWCSISVTTMRSPAPTLAEPHE